MKTPAKTGPTVVDRLRAAVRTYEQQHQLPAGHYQTRRVITATANLHPHMHLRIDVPNGRPRLVGAASVGLDGIRISLADRCPVCRHQTDGITTTTVTYEQIGAAR